MINTFLKRFSGSHYRRFYRKCQPIIRRINALEQQYQKLSDEELRAKTEEFRQRFKAGTSLDDLLPEAFAAVKNAARRLVGQTISYTGTTDTWNMVHYDVQLMGGMALHQGFISEMATGEGKTLVATLPLYLNSLSGRNCQLVTVNEYLAQRDAEWMGHLYRFLGLTVGVIRNQQSPEEKRAAYGADLTYGTSSEFGFDYLRDNGMAVSKETQVQRDHYFAIVDEVDSILIDEARTPLIISGPMREDTTAPYMRLRTVVDALAREQNRLCNRLINDAKTEIEKGDATNWDEALTKMYQVKLGAPKNKILLRLLEDAKTRKRFESFDLEMHGDYNRARRFKLKEELYFMVEEKQRSSDLTEIGRTFIAPSNPDAFVLPDLPTRYMEIDARQDLEPQAKAKAKAEAQAEFERISEEIHVISQLLRAYSLYEKDVEYVVQDGKVMIVDENTGRVMPGRRWSEGLHQAVEAKEGVQVERESRTYATITLQNYFRLYDKLAGMTGTAETEANEFKDIYKMGVMVIPTNKPNIRVDNNDIIFKTRREKFAAVIDEITAAHQRGQPCLVGTVSVDASEVLSRMLKRENIPHSVLNAKYHAQEAEIVAKAGQRGAVTIATNMAGRGTDIKLGPGVAELGGLYVVGTERHTSRRIDRQLRGRSARQGDPGRTRFFLSLEDELMRLYSHGTAGKLLESSFEEGKPLEHRWLNPMIERAQKTVEQHHYSVRRRLLQYDDVGSRQREVVYGLRQQAIHEDKPREIIFELIQEEVEAKAEQFGIHDVAEDSKAIDDTVNWATQTFPISLHADDLRGKRGPEAREVIMARIREAYALKEQAEDPQALVHLERIVVISTIDRHYQTLLTEMEDLRQSVGLRGYGQKDPLVEYKSEAYACFEQMMNQVRADVCVGIFRSATNARALESIMAQMQRRVQTQGPADPDGASGAQAARAALPPAAAAPARPAPASTSPAPAAPQKEIVLPTIRRAPAKPLVEPGRNDTVVIRKGGETQELKWKKAEKMVKDEGWELVSTR